MEVKSAIPVRTANGEELIGVAIRER
jgi:hypothetical protein